jgi:murein DD-endopeptidase MepM/ murein hydrolase activator NlpD
MAEQPWVTTGEAVAKGQVIGPMGSTGLSTGPHTHFIVNVHGVDQDPLAYLP